MQANELQKWQAFSPNRLTKPHLDIMSTAVVKQR